MTFLFSDAEQFVTYAAAVRGSFSTSSGIFDMVPLNHSEHIRLWYRLAMADGEQSAELEGSPPVVPVVSLHSR
jgi:hypothetical protein